MFYSILTRDKCSIVYSLETNVYIILTRDKCSIVYSLETNVYIILTRDRCSIVYSLDNILKALAGTSWGEQKETLLMTYKAVGRSITNYPAPVWCPNLHDTNYGNIQYTQNKALRITTGCHKIYTQKQRC